MEAWREDIRNELMHYGTPRHSGRYPYGSGDRPYQGESTAFRLKKKAESLGKSIKAARTKHKRRKAAAKARQAKIDKAKKAEALEKNKKNPNWVKSHMNELTNDELKAMTDRLNVENNYRDAFIKKLNTGKAYTDFILGYVQTGINAVDNYNKVAKLINGDKEEGEKPLPIIGGKGEARNKAKDKAFKAKMEKELNGMTPDQLKEATTRLTQEATYIKLKNNRR
jgi:hypothetical protein